MAKEPTKADLWWIVEEMVKQVEERRFFIDGDCPICQGEWKAWNKKIEHTKDCAYEAAKLALEGRRNHDREKA